MTTAPPLRRPPADGFSSAYPETFFDALIVVSFGGPEGPEDVMPFLENVTRGRGVPPERLQEVAHHYERFDGKSPINDQNRALIAALRDELDRHEIELPIYFGNRNWHPFLEEALGQMASDGVQRALAFFTSAYSSYSGCRQYRENVHVAQQAVGPAAPEVLRLRAFFNHPGFVEANAELLLQALGKVAVELRPAAHVAFTAHSIPLAMAERCAYEAQLSETAQLVAERAGVSDWAVVYQSRSGPPHVPWLGPDIGDHLQDVVRRGVRQVVAAPIGFVSDHLEVLYDLDVEAAEVAAGLGIGFERAASVGTHPRFVAMIRELVAERLVGGAAPLAIGRLPAAPHVCAPGCCLPGNGRPSPWERQEP